MELYGRPGPQRTPSPAVAFLNERPKSLSFSSAFKPPKVSRGRSEDEFPQIILPDRPSSSQQQNQQQPPPLHQRPASSRFLNRPQSSNGVHRQESFEDAKQRPRTARDSARKLPSTTPAFVKKTYCFTQDTEGPELDGQTNSEELSESSSPNLEEQYLQQLKADILYLHNVHRQLESESENNGDRFSRSTGTQAPNHVKTLLLHRDTKAFLGWSSQDSSSSIQALLLGYNYSSDSAQLTAAKAGLEGLLADTLVSLMDFCIAHDSSISPGSEDNAKMKLVRPPARLQNGDSPILPFANGCGTNPVSIYAGGMLSVLQQTEVTLYFAVRNLLLLTYTNVVKVLKRTMLASTGERKNLVKVIADKDAQLSELTEQIGFFKDALARRRPRFERQKQVIVHYEQENTLESTDNEAVDQSPVSAGQLARLAALEKDQVEFLISMQSLEQQKNELEQQLEKANLELQGALYRHEIAAQQHQESLTVAKNTFQEQIKAMGKQTANIQSLLASSMERHRSLEESSAQEKSQLRRDKQELERLIHRKENELGQRQAQATVKAEAQAQSATAQLQLVTNQLSQAQEALRGLRYELKAAQTDNKQIQSTIHSLHHDLKVRNEDVHSLTSKLAVTQATVESKIALLQQTETHFEASSKEIELQWTLLEEQALQLQILEIKLSRSVPVDDEELQSRQQREESTWHQRVSALEHALVAERQNTALFREQQRKAVVMEQEKADHAVEQAQAVAAELATANLCLLERKRQREQEQTAFEQKLKAYVDRVTELSSDKDGLELKLDTLRSQCEHLKQSKAQTADEAAADEKKLEEELATAKEELKNLTEIRENLDRALAHALATPRGKSVRHHATLSEVRAELQKAKQKSAALEEQLSRNGNIRTTEIDGKLAQLSARERRVAEEQRFVS
ncbi:hypothetical protein V7S43_012502 [Phytophthora oleae]|uniref:Kinesin motor domain-containing protein n=1 Tax=Phytophthora oleae TaxID=2107226 RepID=A0ABD3F711_9STRA